MMLEPLGRAPWWWVAALGAGVAPLGLAVWAGGTWHQTVSAVLVFLVLLPALSAGQVWRAAAVLGLAFTGHNALAIGLTWWSPEQAAPLFPDGHAYWLAQERWIRTGVDPEYDPSTWAGAHLQLALASALLAVLSWGLTPAMQGFYEVDLMNYYVGRVLTHTHDLPAALAALVRAWHPWSVARGLGLTLLTAEVAVWSFQRFTAGPDLHAAGRPRRLVAAVTLLLADAALKVWCLEPVRTHLAGVLQSP